MIFTCRTLMNLDQIKQKTRLGASGTPPRSDDLLWADVDWLVAEIERLQEQLVLSEARCRLLRAVQERTEKQLTAARKKVKLTVKTGDLPVCDDCGLGGEYHEHS